MGWVVKTVVIDLLDVWPCKRQRWWALLFPSQWNQIGLPPWDLHSPFDSIQTILSTWGQWPFDDEMDLRLTPWEMELYHDVSFGHDRRELALHCTAATILHSYANALGPCPCGCRHRGFHLLTLRTGGLRGQYVISKETGAPRFLHPKEAALLLGVLGSYEFVHEVRTSLAMLGLVASPLQVIWIYGHLLRNHRITFQKLPCPRVEDWLRAYMGELMTQASLGFSPVPTPWTLDFSLLGSSMSLSINQPRVSVAQLLQAERISLNWNESISLFHQEERLGLDAFLTAATETSIQLRLQAGQDDRKQPTQAIVIAIQHQDHHQVHLVPPGSFLFEILAEIGLPLVRKVLDVYDKILPVDLRIWHPIAVKTWTEAPWHQPSGYFRLAHGPSLDPQRGLHDGQIWAGICQLTQAVFGHCCPMMIIHPALVPALMHHWISPIHVQQLQLQFQKTNKEIICIAEIDGHWILLYGREHRQCLQWILLDGIQTNLNTKALDLMANLSTILGLDFCPPLSACWTRQLEKHTCGTVALTHLFMLLNPGFMVPATAITCLHDWILQQLPLQGSIFATGPNELSTDQKEKLCRLLQEHGVPESKVPERVQQVIQKLGVPAIVAAFVAKNSWSHLKASANKPGIALRLVLPDELARHAERTAISKYGAGISNHKNKKKTEKGPEPIPSLDPADLILQAGHFKDEDGTALSQISFADIEAEAGGIAIATVQQSQQWLQQTSSISSQALAILTTEELPSELRLKYDISKTSFPATYKGTGEPVLIFGCLKNLGDKKVNRHQAGELAQIDIIPNVVVRLHVYRDELQTPWQDLVKSPVRLLSTLLLPLQLCAGDGCGHDCSKTHPAVGETLDSVIMKVWGRSFGKIEGGRTGAPEATYFSVFLRVPETSLRPLLQSNVQGIYMDPRQDRGPDDRFRVVWLTSRTLVEAQHACKTCLKALGLVRLRFKYGLRVAAADEEMAFKQLKPDATFIATRVQRTFQLFPLPHGLQRAGLIKILNELQWTAKPLQPGRGQQDGISWQVGSTDPPPTTVFTSFGKEVLITETTKKAVEVKPVTFLASSKTQKHLRAEAGTSSQTITNADPWQDVDPWMSWRPTSTEAPPPKSTSGKSHLAEVTGQLREELQASFRKELDEFKQNQDATMQDTAAPATEDRFRRLETTMGEIQAQQSQFNHWFTQVGQASSATENAIQTINYTLSTHQQELQGLHHEIKNVSDTMGATLQKTLANHQSEMSSDFAARFDKLEAMFAKKQRSE